MKKTTFIILIQVMSFFPFALVSEPFIYAPHATTDVKKMKIDKLGITVVTGNRFPSGTQPINKHMVIYNLDYSRSLNWLTEDDIQATVIDTIITSDAVFILHTVDGEAFETEISKFNKADGSLVWRKGINDQPGKGKILAINENTNMIAVAGEHDNAIQVWWYDTDGSFQSHWSKDLSPFINIFDRGRESITTLHLLDDNSVISSSIMQAENIIRVIRTNMTGEKLFDYSHQGQGTIQLDIARTMALLVLPNDKFAFTYIDENLHGVPRFVQFALSADGQELFSKHSDDNVFWGISYAGNILGANGNILNIWNTNGNQYLDLQIFHTDINGIDSQQYSYTYSGKGSFLGVRQVALTSHGGLFMVATRKDPFPELGSSTLYLQWTADGQLCNQTEIVYTDFYPFLQLYNQSIYELRYKSSSNGGVNSIELHVIMHPQIVACLSDIIFFSGFDSP